MNRRFLAVAAVLILLLAAGCGNSPPELNQIYSQLNFLNEPGSERVWAELLVLMNADDEDGYDNLEFIHVINEKQQLFWTVDSDSRSERDNRGMKWIGGQRFMMTEGEIPPPGEYRVIITDKAGERAEDGIFLPIVKEIPAAEDFPEIAFTEDDNIFIIKSAEKRNIISFYDSAGKLLSAYASTPGEVNIRALKENDILTDNWRSMRISFYSDATGAGLISGPYQRR